LVLVFLGARMKAETNFILSLLKSFNFWHLLVADWAGFQDFVGKSLMLIKNV